jgi:hypothetical protein
MNMKKILYVTGICLTALVLLGGCKKYLDINSDKDTPQFPDPSSVFPTQLAAIPRGLQFDARFVSKYVQNFGANSAANVNNFDRMGNNGAASVSDANGDIWRQAYFGLGANLDYIITEGAKNAQWDYVGAAQVLKAMMFQYCTDYHGEIIFYDAFKPQATFKYDDQEVVYKGIDSILKSAITNLRRTDLSPSASRLAKGDYVYNGDVIKWRKFAYGLLARNEHRVTNKGIYNAAKVIEYCDSSLSSFNDDFLIPFDAAKNDDANFFGTFRDNLTLFRQSDFIVRLLDGTVLAGTTPTSLNAFNRDPRMRHMLSCSQDTTNGNGGYRGVAPATGDPNSGATTGVNALRRVPAVWADSIYANPSAANFSTNSRKYLFGDKVVMPVMTASEIFFMKAEAALRSSSASTAHAAYLAGINSHFDFINRGSFNRGNAQLFNTIPIAATQRAAYLVSANVKQTPASLTLTDVMLQKYIALWGWGFFETWVDMRRYHYTDLDPVTGQQVYRSFTPPAPLFAENNNKFVYRVRPRYNSEYVWNRDELFRLGGLNSDYLTYECWFSRP